MRSSQLSVFLLWDFGTEAQPLEIPMLRAVDLSRELAQEHKDFLDSRDKYGVHYEIERRSTNHLFAKNSLGRLDKLKERKIKP